VHRKPSVKRLDCYVGRFGKAFGEFITRAPGIDDLKGIVTNWALRASTPVLTYLQMTDILPVFKSNSRTSPSRV